MLCACHCATRPLNTWNTARCRGGASRPVRECGRRLHQETLVEASRWIMQPIMVASISLVELTHIS